MPSRIARTATFLLVALALTGRPAAAGPFDNYSYLVHVTDDLALQYLQPFDGEPDALLIVSRGETYREFAMPPQTPMEAFVLGRTCVMTRSGDAGDLTYHVIHGRPWRVEGPNPSAQEVDDCGFDRPLNWLRVDQARRAGLRRYPDQPERARFDDENFFDGALLAFLSLFLSAFLAGIVAVARRLLKNTRAAKVKFRAVYTFIWIAPPLLTILVFTANSYFVWR